MYVPFRIYHDIESGTIIQETGNFTDTGLIEIPSVERDVIAYSALSERNRETFGVIELEYGQFVQDFAECNGYRVNPETKELEFSYPVPNEPETPPVYVKPLTEQIADLEAKTDQAVMELTMIIAMGGMV